jgi:TrmH family RNA methyltransferase
MLDVTPTVFEKLAFGQRGEGLVAVAETPQRSLDDLRLSSDALVAVLEGVEKPGNVGAVLRSADAAGVAALILAGGGTDLFNPNAIRASLGAIFTLPVAAAASSEVRRWLLREGFSIHAACVDGATCYTQVSFLGRTAMVLGSEAEGLTDLWRGEGITSVRLPMQGVVDSLNVSATAAVLFFEAQRQRGQHKAGPDG